MKDKQRQKHYKWALELLKDSESGREHKAEVIADTIMDVQAKYDMIEFKYNTLVNAVTGKKK
jgi:alkyl hydroperoxide reductase subunit AhpC